MRQRFGPRHRESVQQPDLTLLDETLQIARRTVDAWGGQLIIVVLPEYGLLVGQHPERVRYESVMRHLHQQALPVIDGGELFQSLKEPTRLFALGSGGHPNAEGHALIANQILLELGRRGVGLNDLEEIDVDQRAPDAHSKSVRTGVRTSSGLFTIAIPRD